MSDNTEEEIVAYKPIFKVDRVYAQGSTEVSSYEIALRIGSWTETTTVPKRHWLNNDDDFDKLRKDIQDAKARLLSKYQIFAEEFPEVESYGQNNVEAKLRAELQLPKLEEVKPVHKVSGELVTE